jgi:hypothetical protein
MYRPSTAARAALGARRTGSGRRQGTMQSPGLSADRPDGPRARGRAAGGPGSEGASRPFRGQSASRLAALQQAGRVSLTSRCVRPEPLSGARPANPARSVPVPPAAEGSKWPAGPPSDPFHPGLDGTRASRRWSPSCVRPGAGAAGLRPFRRLMPPIPSSAAPLQGSLSADAAPGAAGDGRREWPSVGRAADDPAVRRRAHPGQGRKAQGATPGGAPCGQTGPCLP